MIAEIVGGVATLLSGVSLIYVVRKLGGFANKIGTLYGELLEYKLAAETFKQSIRNLSAANVELESKILLEIDARKAAERQRDQLLTEAIKYESTKEIAARINKEIRALVGRRS